jgi:hypothetical protein
MNRKHLIQLVATLGTVLVLYVLSVGPMAALLSSNYAPSMKTEEILKDVYYPIVWLSGKSYWFNEAIIAWCRFCD